MFYSEVGSLFAQIGKKWEKSFFFFRMFVWKVAGMFWHLERNFLTKIQRNFAHYLKTIWKNEEDFEEEIFSRQIFEHVQCTFDNSARKILSRNFLAGKPKKNKSWSKSFTRRVVKKVKKNYRKRSLHVSFFEPWEAVSTKLAQAFLPEVRKVFSQNPQIKQKRFFQAVACSLQNFPVDTYNAVPTGLPQI